ncbi:MAG: chorismate synthase [Phycisphaerales bacterium]|nr:chorismate synthase [Phycisphaerales bacterium]
MLQAILGVESGGGKEGDNALKPDQGARSIYAIVPSSGCSGRLRAMSIYRSKFSRSSVIESPNLGFIRPTNNAGGTEGGMTNAMPIVVTGTMKPIATLLKGLPSVDLNTKQPEHSQYERSDVCAVSAASVVMENVVAFEVARCFADKFGGYSMTELRLNFERYMDMARSLPLQPDEGTIA